MQPYTVECLSTCNVLYCLYFTFKTTRTSHTRYAEAKLWRAELKPATFVFYKILIQNRRKVFIHELRWTLKLSEHITALAVCTSPLCFMLKHFLVKFYQL